MAKRIKKKDDIYTIMNIQQADTHLGKLGELQDELQQLEIDADKDIADIKANLKKQSDKKTQQIQKHLRSLEAFCSRHPELFEKQRSFKLIFGVIGFRKSTKITTKKTTIKKIKDVFGKLAERYLHTKESPDKEAMAKLSDDQLKSIDAKRVITDDFYAEPDLIKIKNQNNNNP